MPEKQRVNGHRSRTGTNGKAIKATHNDHNFTADHIDPNLTAQNRVWQFQDVTPDPDYKTKFEQDRYEQAVYEKYFKPYLEARNAKAIKGRQPSRVQTIEQFRQNKKACPEEILFTIGNVNNPTDPETLAKIFEEYVKWHEEQFPNVMLLNAYLHVDEPNAAPHIQLRVVWTAHEDDMLIISQRKALEEMGIERPDPDKPINRNNNAKMTYTTICRQKQIELARAHGLEIEDKPQEPSKSGKTLLQLKVETLQAEVDALTEQVGTLTAEKEQAHEKLLSATKAPPRPRDPHVYGSWEHYDCHLEQKRFESDKAFEKRKHKVYEEYAAPIRQDQADWDSKWGLVDCAQRVIDREATLDSREQALTEGEADLARRISDFSREVEQAVKARTRAQEQQITYLQAAVGTLTAELDEVTAERDELHDELYPPTHQGYRR